MAGGWMATGMGGAGSVGDGRGVSAREICSSGGAESGELAGAAWGGGLNFRASSGLDEGAFVGSGAAGGGATATGRWPSTRALASGWSFSFGFGAFTLARSNGGAGAVGLVGPAEAA